MHIVHRKVCFLVLDQIAHYGEYIHSVAITPALL